VTRRPFVPRWLQGLAATAVLATAGLGTLTFAANPDVVLDALLQRPAAAGTVVVPDRFLRSWDPVTVFFPAGRGPAAGGPEDAPERHVKLLPAHPGAWTWLDGRTLQFRPAEPWPPLETVSVTVDGRATALSSLLPPPTDVDPPHGATGLQPVDTLTVTFPRPVDPKALARMVAIQLRPLPGTGEGPALWLRSTDFEIKVLERAHAEAPASYALVLHQPIPLGQRAVLRVALSHDEASEEAVFEHVFSTAEPFRPRTIGCDGGSLPVSPEGTRHPAERPLRCVRDRSVRIAFSAALGGVGPLEGRNLVRFEPAVEGLRFDGGGTELRVRGDFRSEVPYRVSLVPSALTDVNGRPLEIRGESVAWLYFPRRESRLSWGVAQGVAELRGPRRVPVQGNGVGEVDVRVYRVEPTNRSFWPFPDAPLAVDEETAPPGPGEGPGPWTEVDAIPPHELTARLAALGSPARSEVVPVGLDGERSGRTGLDLGPILERAAGQRPGHWLVGMRRLDGSAERQWIRLQVTDLALTTVENETDVWFQVTSLQTGAPVAGATIRLDGVSDDAFRTLVTLRTGADGSVTWKAPGEGDHRVGRVSVQSGDDVLVLDPEHAPDRFEDGAWLDGYGGWLDWAFQELTDRAETPRTMVHLFPERPIYRPGEEVHLKGYLRSRFQGHLTPLPGAVTVQVQGPDNSYDLPVTVSANGSFDTTWLEEAPATGVYTATVRDGDGVEHGRATFRVEAYRLPTFEVDLSVPRNRTTLPNDAPFDVGLSGAYYAGGKVAARPVRWRVTRYPYAWQPKVGALEGFAWSSDDRYGRGGGFRATPELAIEGTTDDDGGASITLDPGLEADGRARTWVVEATVTGADDQTVTANLSVNTVPAFVLGLKAPRWLDEATAIPVEVVAVGPDGAPVPGLELTVKTVHRQWHSLLQQSDFTTGEARYLTDVVDVPRGERAVVSGAAPTAVSLPIEEPGVYLVEVEARDALGRAQVVRVDLFARGEGAVSWEKPKGGTFDLSLDQPSYQPGQTARIVVRSPFQEGHALVVIEEPEGNRYQHLTVRGGQATVSIPVKTGWVPQVPVHVVLRRGRGPEAATLGQLDLERPQTVAASTKLVVEPVEHQVKVALKVPEKALPGATVPVTVSLADPRGKPLGGEVTLWLVDRAVLALAKEARLDPVPDFVDDRGTHASLRDTRNDVLGQIPYEEDPGGDGEESNGDGVLSNATVRKDFRPLAYWAPALQVPSTGSITVQVKLPDNATIWAVRAKAISGTERFGAGTAELPVRLPVVVEPALPRFVRPGDSFAAGALARVVEGPGGAGAAEISVRGLTVEGAKSRDLSLDAAKANRLAWTLGVPTPAVGPTGLLLTQDVSVKVGVRRASDGASDAFEVVLPLYDDRRPRYERTLLTLAPGASGTVPALREPAREGSVERRVVVASDDAVVRMAAALDVLRRTEPQSADAAISRGRVAVGLGALRAPLGLEDDDEVKAVVTETNRWLASALDPNGLVAQWPGTPGRVWLTADALAFLGESAAQGYPVDAALVDATTRALTAALRSDYRHFVSGESWMERTTALWGLSAGGKLDPAFVSELARNSRLLAPEGRAKVLLASSRGTVESPLLAALTDDLVSQIQTELYQGTERYAGLASLGARSPLVAPSETRQLATLTQALVAVRPTEPKLPLARDALVRLGAEDGWGQPNADAAALLALADWLKKSPVAPPSAMVEQGGAVTLLAGLAGQPAASLVAPVGGVTKLTNNGKTPLVVLVVTRWIPQADGGETAPEAHGLVVEREWQVVRATGPSDKAPVTAGAVLRVKVGDVLEEHVRLVNPEERYHVALTVPLAAGVEPMNPALLTSGRDATPTNVSTARPSWSAFLDDRVRYAFETLPKGTYDLYFRTRVSMDGSFVQPAAWAEMIYDRDVNGSSAGGRVVGAAQ
jgi:uncharacterized protein YfaS (alpha-2-macroglobulin family)